MSDSSDIEPGDVVRCELPDPNTDSTITGTVTDLHAGYVYLTGEDGGDYAFPPEEVVEIVEKATR